MAPRLNRMTEGQLSRAKEAFISVDLDGSGSLDTEELCAALKKLGHEVSVQKMKQLIAPYDLNGDGSLDLREFVNMLELNSSQLEVRDEPQAHNATRSRLSPNLPARPAVARSQRGGR